MKRNISLYINMLIIVSGLVSLIFLPGAVNAALGINTVTPNSVSNTQNTTITISGNDFALGAVVSLDGYGTLNSSFFSATTLMATVPAGVPVGLYTVTVTNPDHSTVTLPNSLSVTQNVATVAPTATTDPVYGYERPVIVVNSYDISQEKIAPGDYFILYITLYNAGQQYAKNVVATFTAGDLIPRETGGVVAAGEIAPSNRLDIAQPLVLSSEFWGSDVSISMLVSYADEKGLLYSESFSITLPVYHTYSASSTSTPTPTASPTPSLKPQLVITGYKSDVYPLQPGVQFSLQLNIQNKGSSTARHVTMIVGGGSTSGGDGGTQQAGGISGGSGEFTNFAPLGSSNVQSLGEFNPDASLIASQSLIVNVNTTPGAYPLKISFVYQDDQNHSFTDDQVITLLVYRLPSVDINFYQAVAPFFTYQTSSLPLQVVNLGRNSIVLGNMRVTATTGQFSNSTILVGTLEPGGYFTLDAGYTPDMVGPVELTVTIDYTNDFNQSQVITKTLSIDVVEQPVVEPPIDGGQDGGSPVTPAKPETFIQKVWRFLLGIFGLNSGIDNSQTPINGEPQGTTTPSDVPIIKPVQPPLKGP